MQVVLEVIDGTQAGKRFAFDRHNTFMVGRGERAHFRIPDDRYFSRHHFMIEVSPPRCFLRDLGSTNGTYVNRQKVRQAHLNDGDVIHGGRTQIRVRIEGAEPAVPPLPAGEASPQPGPSMTTLPIDGAAPPDRPGGLRCTVCGKPAAEALVGELADTRIIAYACPECHEKHRDEQHPVPNYEVLGVAGRGSLGPVYKARRISSGKLVALKVIPEQMASDPQAVRLFLRQMRLGAGLRHPNIAPVVEMGQAGAELWVATEFVDGLDAARLAEHLGGRLPVADAAGIVAQVLDALDYAHRLNLVHRDVKPTNIMVSGEPGGYRAWLSDFGLIRNMDEAGLSGITREGQCRGTVPFMPPEQVLESRFAKPAGDVYAAGATLYWLLTGQYAYDFEARDARGEVKDPFLVILEDPIVPLRQRDPGVPEPVARVIQSALAREPDDRPETAAEMAGALRGAIGAGA